MIGFLLTAASIFACGLAVSDRLWKEETGPAERTLSAAVAGLAIWLAANWILAVAHLFTKPALIAVAIAMAGVAAVLRSSFFVLRRTTLLLLLPSIVGCAELRSEFMPATGEPLRIHDRTVTRTGVEQVETGHTENSRGETTSTSYANQVVHWSEREYYALQGGARLDDESFYRITNDQDAVARYDAYHHGGVKKNVLGWILMTVGLGVTGGLEHDAPRFADFTG